MTKQMQPHWMTEIRQTGAGSASSLATHMGWKVWNRSGGASVAGHMYQFDMANTTTSTTEVDQYGKTLSAVTTANWMAEDSWWRNVVTPALTHHGYFCIAREAVADNAEMAVDVICDGKMNVTAFQGYCAPITVGTAITWTAGTDTLACTGAFTGLTAALAIVGATAIEFVVTAGTGATLGTYTVASKVDNNSITVTPDIAAGNLSISDFAGYLRVTFPAGSKIEPGTAAGGNLTNAASANRRVAMLSGNTVLRADQVAGSSGQSVSVIFSGFGLQPQPI